MITGDYREASRGDTLWKLCFVVGLITGGLILRIHDARLEIWRRDIGDQSRLETIAQQKFPKIRNRELFLKSREVLSHIRELNEAIRYWRLGELLKNFYLGDPSP